MTPDQEHYLMLHSSAFEPTVVAGTVLSHVKWHRHKSWCRWAVNWAGNCSLETLWLLARGSEGERSPRVQFGANLCQLTLVLEISSGNIPFTNTVVT